MAWLFCGIDFTKKNHAGAGPLPTALHGHYDDIAAGESWLQHGLFENKKYCWLVGFGISYNSCWLSVYRSHKEEIAKTSHCQQSYEILQHVSNLFLQMKITVCKNSGEVLKTLHLPWHHPHLTCGIARPHLSIESCGVCVIRFLILGKTDSSMCEGTTPMKPELMLIYILTLYVWWWRWWWWSWWWWWWWWVL